MVIHFCTSFLRLVSNFKVFQHFSCFSMFVRASLKRHLSIFRRRVHQPLIWSIQNVLLIFLLKLRPTDWTLLSNVASLFHNKKLSHQRFFFSLFQRHIQPWLLVLFFLFNSSLLGYSRHFLFFHFRFLYMSCWWKKF